jgi:Xaa-Pro aminopeptidase
MEPGDMFFIDLSVCLRGYYIDFCRTVVIGEPTPDQQTVFNGVMACHAYVKERLRPGLTGAEVFELGLASHTETTPQYKDVINWVWLGHGTGLIISEPPFFTQGESRTIKENSFVNIEPGLFVPGVGNSSIEDTLFVTGDGASFVTECPRELHVA